jgi:serine/threonine protein phosphatase PrpC
VTEHLGTVEHDLAGEPLPAGWVQAGTPPPSPSAGPTVSFRFNLAKVPGEGEDSDPILREGRDLALLGVFDGMGGAGGTVYETPDGPRTGAYLASRIASEVVEARMVDLLEPDWYLDGPGAAEDLQRSVRAALQARLAELDAPPSGLRSKLLRALPTTMAVVALQRGVSASGAWTAHVLSAGDSRAYAFEPDGATQLTTDDLRNPSDAMTNLRQDSVVSNAMSADTDFEVRYRKVRLQAPFLIVCATDGCFGYLPSPMHFEHLVLSHLQTAEDAATWSAGLQAAIAEVTGDDAAMALMAVGADLAALQARYGPRLAELAEEFLRPLDEAAAARRAAEAAAEEARRAEQSVTADVWARYKRGYERHLAAEQAVPGAPAADHDESEERS